MPFILQLVYKAREEPRASRGEIGQAAQAGGEDRPGPNRGLGNGVLNLDVKPKRRKHFKKVKEFKKRWKKTMEYGQNMGVENVLRKLVTRVRDMVEEEERVEGVHHVLGEDGIKGQFKVVVEPAKR